MRELALFGGGGGGILGSHLLGWETVCACEIEDYPRRVLFARQKDGILPRFPIWDDIRTFDGKIWQGRVDIITGGFPCQDISCAGKGQGIEGERSGLWAEMFRVVCEVEPRFVFLENSPLLTKRGLEKILRELASVGYNARWCVLGAEAAGAPHKRERIWLLAYASCCRGKESAFPGWEAGNRSGNESKIEMANTDVAGLQRKSTSGQETGIRRFIANKGSKIEWWNEDPADVADTYSEWKLQSKGCEQNQRGWVGNKSKKISNTYSYEQYRGGSNVQVGRERIQEKAGKGFDERRNQWGLKSRMDRVAYGIPDRVGKLKALGNSQVPAVAVLAFIILSQGLI